MNEPSRQSPRSSPKPIGSRILKTIASVKVGVVVILVLGCLIAWGTLVEAHYNDSVAAQKTVYHSIWMYGAMLALATTLIAVMIDRWPWQQKHLGFILAHIGILILMAGAVTTQYFGLDGSMSVGLGEKSRYVLIDSTVLSVYATLGDETGFRKLFEKKVDFFSDRPTVEHPYELPVESGTAKITDYLPYAFRDEKVVESQRKTAGTAVRFQLQNSRVSLTEWLVQPGPGREVSKNLGPAVVILATGETAGCGEKNCLLLKPGKEEQTLDYEIHTAREPKNVKRGHIKSGEQLDTGWMGLVLRILKIMPHAEEEVFFQASEQASPMSSPAIRVSYNGEQHWLGLNSMMRVFTDQAAYLISYGNERRDVGFDVLLKDFKVGRYPGTMRAASYASEVMVPGVGEATISMNEPLKHDGLTLYQASFQEDPETGRPVVSVFSVNRDPGRWIKYLGSLLIVCGIIHLFYFKRKAASHAKRSAGKTAQSEVYS